MDSEKIIKMFETVTAWIKFQVEEFFSYFETLSRQDIVLQVLILTVVFIFVITVIIAIAVILLRVKNNWNARRFHRLEESWEGQIMDLLSGDDPELVGEIEVKRRDRLFYVQYLYRFAGRFRGQELQIIKALARPHLEMIAKKIDKGYPELRARNVNILATLGFPEFIQPIIDSLKDGAPIVKMAAARILAHSDYPEHIDLILPELASFDGWSMNFLASMLAEMGPEVVPRLRAEFLNPEGSRRVRIAAAEALRSIGALGAADAAASVLEDENDPELSAACLKLLAELGTPRHRPILVHLTHSENEIIRLHSMSALGSIGGDEDLQLLEDALVDPSPWVVLQAARAMVQLRGLERLMAISRSEHLNAGVVHQVLAEARH